MPPPPHKSIWQNQTPGAFKSLTRWLSKPGTKRSRVTNVLRWKFRGQWKVGEDYIGNEYYIYQPFPETPIRRFCIFKQGQIGMDDLPFLWYQWIRYQRNYPPTQKEMNEYENYLRETQEKAAKIKARDDAEIQSNPQFFDEQKRQLEAQHSELTNKAQREVIAMFASRENALRVAAENKVAKMQEADNIIQAERRRYEEMQFEKMKESYLDPESTEPTQIDEEKPEQFTPGAWRPWQEENDENNQNDQQSKQ
eukprot:945502_1